MTLTPVTTANNNRSPAEEDQAGQDRIKRIHEPEGDVKTVNDHSGQGRVPYEQLQHQFG